MRLISLGLAAALFAGASPAGATEVLLLPETGPNGHFVFHSDRWMNLHHFLYHWARTHQAAGRRFRGSVELDAADRAVDLGEHQAAWDAAARAYLELVDRDLQGGEGMRELKVAIAAGPDGWPEETPFNELKAVMPIYQSHWWPRHDATNRALIRILLDGLDRHGVAIAAHLTADYESRWPEEPINVQVSYYTNWAGAYTSWGPNLVMMASGRETVHGPYGLEILFHEAGHTKPLGAKVRPLSRATAAEADVDEGDVWHAVLFHVSGAAVRSALGDHIPYAVQFGLWERGRWDGLRPIVENAFAETAGLEARLRAIHAARAE